MISLDDGFFSTNFASSTSYHVHLTHVAHHCLQDLRPVTHFPLSTRSDDENYDVGAILHQCFRESIVRFLIETIVCIIKCVQSAIERI